MTHFSCKLQITKSFHCSGPGPLQETLNLTLQSSEDKAPSLEMCIIFYSYSSLSFPNFCFNPYFNLKLGFIWLCCCVVVPNWNIAKLLLSPRTIFNWNFWSSALLSLCQPPPHILFRGHHQLLQFVLEIMTMEAVFKLPSSLIVLRFNQTRPFEPSIGEVEISVSTPGLVVLFESCWV